MKGISNIVSAVILIAIGVTAASIYAEWAPSLAEDIIGDVTDETNRKISCDNADISIDEVEYDRTAQTVYLDLKNEGTIRLSQGLAAGAFNSSREINRTSISSLEVGETLPISITSDKIPDTVLVTSNDCPEIEARARNIEIT